MIIVMRTYIPKAGTGGTMMNLLKQVQTVFTENGFPVI